MKKVVYLCLALFLASCTSLEKLKNETAKTDSSTEKNWNIGGELKTEKIILNTSATEGILSDISNSLKRGYVKEYNTTYRDNYEVYVGDYVSLPLGIGEDSYNMFFSPLGTSYELEIKDGKLYFRSIYQGNYEIMIYSAGSFSRKITITNKLKYEFTEQNNYEVIAQNYQSNNLKGLSNSVAVHRIAFPNSFRDKEISFMLMELAGKDGNTKVVKEEIEFLKKYKTLDEQDKLTILDTLSGIGSAGTKLDPVLLEYNSANTILNPELKKIILSKTSVDRGEIEFLEKYFRDEPTKETAEFIGNWYLKNGDINRGTQYINGTIEGIAPELLESIFTKAEGEIVDPMAELENKNYTQFRSFLSDGESSFNQGSYVEALVHFEKALSINKDYAETKDIYFYMGQSNFQLENYQKAIDNYKKALNIEKSDDKKAEIYYNMGIAYDKLGNKEESRNYFTFVRQKFPKSSWSTKSSIYLLKLN